MLISEKTDSLNSAILVEKGNFIIKIAETEVEILQAKQLRYRAFMAEKNNATINLDSQIDEDEFDAQFTHLLVVDRANNCVAGTYRMQSGVTAQLNLGFYSSTEYDIKGIEHIAEQTWEVGRSCVDPKYRSGTVIALLWAGISAMQKRENFRYLMGCVSLVPTVLEAGWAMYEQFSKDDIIVDKPFGYAKKKCVLPINNPITKEDFLTHPEKLKEHFPPLLKGYLRLGAKIAGEPAYDKEFGSIDFLILFDFNEMNSKYAKHFMKN